MDLKKSKSADLEKKRGTFLQIGLIVALSMILIVIEWKTKRNDQSSDNIFTATIFEPEIAPWTAREQSKIVTPKIEQILKLVPDDVPIDENYINFDPEVNTGTSIDFNDIPDIPEVFTDEPPFSVVEDMPIFNGGKPEIEFRKYISQNLNYPEIAAINGVCGKVYVQFVVNDKGKVINAVVLNPFDPALDKEALRVINSSPLWIPGKQRQKPVKVIFTFPINFVLK
jgi:protein TonB